MPRSKQEAKKRKKRRGHISKDAPYPVPIASSMVEPMEQGAWFYYTGYIEGSAVVVKHSGDIDFLHKMGYFGKGTLSRSEPSFHERKQKVNVRVRKLVKGASEPKPTLIRAALTSKRNYLVHKRYKALLDGNGTEYNYIIHCEEQQKLGLEGLSDEEEYIKDDEEEDEEEEADSDDGGPRAGFGGGGRGNMMEAFHMLDGGRGQFELNGGEAGSSTLPRRQSFSEASKETRTSVVALLSEIAKLSNETIATFAKVPYTMAQLRDKYDLLRRAEIALHQQRQGEAGSGRFRPGEVIEVDDIEDDGGGGGDSVVVLDSDEEDDDNDDDDDDDGKKGVETEGKEKDLGKKGNAVSKGWGDYDEGDDDCWGVAQNNAEKTESKPESTNDTDDPAVVEGSKTDNTKCGKDSLKEADSKINNAHDDKDAVETTQTKDTADETGSNTEKMEGGKDSTEVTDSKMDKQESKNAWDKAADRCEDNVSQDKSGMVSEVPGMQNGDTLSKDNKSSEAEVTDTRQSLSDSLQEQSDKCALEPSLAKISVDTENEGGEKSQETEHASNSVSLLTIGVEEDDTSTKKMVSENKSDSILSSGDASNDSDDVICIESESATPSSVHNLLSQPHTATVTKSVTFMSNLTLQPSYVSAKVGFNSWDSLIHFNYTGDPTHLPTVMAVDNQHTSNSKGSAMASSSDAASNQVYERLFPPVSTLLPAGKSQGAVIKQRVKGLPCLSSAYLNLNMLRVPVTPSTSLFSSVMSRNSNGNARAHSQQAAHHSPRQQHPAVKRKFQQSTPHSSQASAEKQTPVLSSTVSPIAPTDSHSLEPELKTTISSSNKDSSTQPEKFSDSIRPSAQPPSSESHFHPAVVQKYLKVFCESSKTGEDSCGELEAPKLVSDTEQSSVLSLSSLVQQLRHLYTKSGSETCSSLPDSPKVTNLLSQFHTLLSQYLPDAGVPPEKESELLRSLVSASDHLLSFPDKETVDTIKSLTDFQVRLLEQRLNHITKDVSDDKGGAASQLGNGRCKRKNEDPEANGSKRHKSNCLEENKDAPREKSSPSSDHEINESTTVHKDSTSADISKSESEEISSGVSHEHSKGEEANKGSHENESISTDPKRDNLKRSSSLSENEKERQGNTTVAGSAVENGTSDSSIEKSMSEISSGEMKKYGIVNNSSVSQICIDSSSEDIETEDSSSEGSPEMSPEPSLDARALCRSEDPDGELFVINNTSEEEELEDETDVYESEHVKNAHRWRPCVKEDPHPVQERLHLMLEEAFFLSYGLGCLRILDPEMKVLDLTETWCQFQVLKEQFVPHYVAYHYFRSKGWVPKSGLKFGCDFILYREGPPFYHGSYSVVVQCVQEGSLLPCTRREGFKLDHRHLNWISLAGLNRITEHVAKELMFCYVIWPKGFDQEELLSPACISKFKVKEMLVSRWVSSQERENKTEEEMP